MYQYPFGFCFSIQIDGGQKSLCYQWSGVTARTYKRLEHLSPELEKKTRKIAKGWATVTDVDMGRTRQMITSLCITALFLSFPFENKKKHFAGCFFRKISEQKISSCYLNRNLIKVVRFISKSTKPFLNGSKMAVYDK